MFWSSLSVRKHLQSHPLLPGVSRAEGQCIKFWGLSGLRSRSASNTAVVCSLVPSSTVFERGGGLSGHPYNMGRVYLPRHGAHKARKVRWITRDGANNS